MNRVQAYGCRSAAQRVCMLGVAMLLASSVAGQPTPYQRAQQTPSIAALTRHQVVVFNDGNYALVDNKSASDRQKQKDVEAKCPQGMKAMSAGFAAASGAGEPRGYRVILSTPKDNGDGWKIYAAFDSSGNLLAADFDWELRIHLVCAKLG